MPDAFALCGCALAEVFVTGGQPVPAVARGLMAASGVLMVDERRLGLSTRRDARRPVLPVSERY